MKFDNTFNSIYEDIHSSTSFNYKLDDISTYSTDIDDLSKEYDIDKSVVEDEIKKALDNVDSDDIIIHKEIIAEVRRSIRELKLQETYDGIAKVDQEIPNMNKGFLK
jgi:hypothetical protein